MKLIRFITETDQIAWGIPEDGGEMAREIQGDIFGAWELTGRQVPVKKTLPVMVPAAILCIGLNYRRHAEETGFDLPEYPALFMKNPGAVIGSQETIVLPPSCMAPPQVDYEAELAVVIKKAARNVPESEALDYVLGYTCANDVSARRWQKHAGAGQWVRGKSFDTFCPLGPVLVTADEIPDPQNLEIACTLNRRVMQQSNTSDMVFSVAQIISYLSQSTTLLPGTVILTGTPEGVGYTRTPPVYLMPGDRVAVEIQGIGCLENQVETAAAAEA